jgi:hypothetical protein
VVANKNGTVHGDDGNIVETTWSPSPLPWSKQVELWQVAVAHYLGGHNDSTPPTKSSSAPLVSSTSTTADTDPSALPQKEQRQQEEQQWQELQALQQRLQALEQLLKNQSQNHQQQQQQQQQPVVSIGDTSSNVLTTTTRAAAATTTTTSAVSNPKALSHIRERHQQQMKDHPRIGMDSHQTTKDKEGTMTTMLTTTTSHLSGTIQHILNQARYYFIAATKQEKEEEEHKDSKNTTTTNDNNNVEKELLDHAQSDGVASTSPTLSSSSSSSHTSPMTKYATTPIAEGVVVVGATTDNHNVSNHSTSKTLTNDDSRPATNTNTSNITNGWQRPLLWIMRYGRNNGDTGPSSPPKE